MIATICCYFNWNNNETRKNNYKKFIENFEHPVEIVEIARKKKDFWIDGSLKILANINNVLWQKERAFNILIEQLPDKYNKILWLDTDIIFKNKNFLGELEDKLDNHCMVQPFESVYELNKGVKTRNQPLNTFGFAKTLDHYKKTKQILANYPALGLCWGFKRSVLKHGFYDKHILGSSDMLQVQSVTLDVLNSEFLGKYTDGVVLSWLDYCNKMPPQQTYSIGYCSGEIEHLYHGKACNRGYQYREYLLAKYNFDPAKDLKIDYNGLYRITNKNLRDEILEYFNIRNLGTEGLS